VSRLDGSVSGVVVVYYVNAESGLIKARDSTELRGSSLAKGRECDGQPQAAESRIER
jgi:hypothetical protein